MKIKMYSLKTISFVILSFFIINFSEAQNLQGKLQKVESEKNGKVDTALSQPAHLWIVRVIQSMNLSSWSLSASVGPSVFSGDIKQFDWFPMSHKYLEDKLIPEQDAKVPSNYQVGSTANSKVSERKWSGVFSINKQFGTILAVQGEFLFGTLSGVSYKTYTSSELDGNGKYLTLPYHSDYFIAQYHEFDLNAIVNLNKVMFPYRHSGRFGVYVFGGIGLNTFKSSLRDLKTDISENDNAGIANPKNSTYKRDVIKEGLTTETVFPVGLGIKYHLTPHWSVFLEYSRRFVNTDKLDSWVNSVTQHDSYEVLNLGLNFSIGSVSDSTLEARLKPRYKLQMKAHPTKSRLEARVDSLERMLGDLGHRVNELESSSKQGVSEDTLKAIEQKLMESIPKTGLNTMAYSSSNAVTQLLVVFFDFNSYRIPAKYHTNIALVAKILKNNPNVKVQIVGHADKVGSSAYNMILSRKRAEAVAKELEDAYGIAPSRLNNIVSKGKEDLLSSKYNDVNRRVDFIFTIPVENMNQK